MRRNPAIATSGRRIWRPRSSNLELFLDPSWQAFGLDREGTVDANLLSTGEQNSMSGSAKKPRLLDLFCCAGGAAIGYARAGFEVVGVDIKPQPRYPREFIQADALTLDRAFIASFDAIHASPPCQSYSDLAKRNGNADAWPRLVDPVRELLIRSGLPYVIENVEGAPLRNPVILCGTMFKGLRVLRHRLFETNFPVVVPSHGKHPRVHTFDKRKSQYGKTDDMVDFVSVNGGGNCTVAAASDAMGIDWMTKNELNEAIPPIYTQFIGKQLLAHLLATRKSKPARTRPMMDQTGASVGASVESWR